MVERSRDSGSEERLGPVPKRSRGETESDEGPRGEPDEDNGPVDGCPGERPSQEGLGRYPSGAGSAQRRDRPVERADQGGSAADLQAQQASEAQQGEAQGRSAAGIFSASC